MTISKALKFKHVYALSSPVDFFDGCQIANEVMRKAVLMQMPEEARSETVYQFFFPNPPDMEEAYLCKADNNGTTYLFTNASLVTLCGDFVAAHEHEWEEYG